MPVFGDSVELSGYSQGTCGEKDVTLVSPPSFISLTKGANPLKDPFTISYDLSKASVTDIGIHTIQYTVKITEYVTLTTQLTGSFTFELA